jgi:hypothetical protein
MKTCEYRPDPTWTESPTASSSMRIVRPSSTDTVDEAGKQALLPLSPRVRVALAPTTASALFDLLDLVEWLDLRELEDDVRSAEEGSLGPEDSGVDADMFEEPGVRREVLFRAPTRPCGAVVSMRSAPRRAAEELATRMTRMIRATRVTADPLTGKRNAAIAARLALSHVDDPPQFLHAHGVSLASVSCYSSSRCPGATAGVSDHERSHKKADGLR